jgi:hypothetical protein
MSRRTDHVDGLHPRFLNRGFETQEYGIAVARGGSMAKPRKRDNGAPQNAGTTTAVTIDRDRCAHRAYELYLARGGEDGRDLEDWLTAERELRERRPLQTQGQ